MHMGTIVRGVGVPLEDTTQRCGPPYPTWRPSLDKNAVFLMLLVVVLVVFVQLQGSTWKGGRGRAGPIILSTHNSSLLSIFSNH